MRPAYRWATAALRAAAIAILFPSLAAPGTVTGGDLGPTSLDQCHVLTHNAPGDFHSYECYLRVARRNHQWKEAARDLEALLTRDADNHYARAYLARIEADLGHDRAEELFRQAADGYASQGNYVAEAALRASFSFYLANQRARIGDAEAELARAREAALATGDPIQLAWVELRRAMLAAARQDYGRALLLLRQVKPDVFPNGPASLRQVWLSEMGYNCWALGRLEAAMRFYEQEAGLMQALGWTFEEAVPRRNMAFIAGLMGLDTEQRLELARQALAVARRGGNTEIEGSSHYDLAFLAEAPEQLDHAREALAIARKRDAVDGIRKGLRAMALALVEVDPERAFEHMEEAIVLSERYGDRGEIPRNLAFRAELRRRSGPREQAVADSLAALDAIEATRNLQPDATVRARNFATWSTHYYDLAAFLLAAALEGREGTRVRERELEMAFGVMERMRARTLLDELDAARAGGALAPSGPVADERREVLEAIARAQRVLMNPELADRERTTAAEELRQLELEAAELRDRLARADPAFSALRQPELATLDQVREALGDDRALLIFQLAPGRRWGEARSWLLVVSPTDIRVYPLPGSPRIRPAVRLFLGLLGRRDGSEERGAASLYGELLEAALDDLPAGIDRLVIVPDQVLFLLPFGSLRPLPSAQPLAARFDISLVPSATMWLRWSHSSAAKAGRRVLALANPALEYAGAREPEQALALRASALGEAAALGSLPYARREGRSISKHLRGRAVVLAGESATEQSLKRTDLSGFGVLHLAAHALIDHEEPHRSAIVLAPGAEEEDGLLQIREIVELDLDNQLVVLSACRSATGPILAGEGPLALARGFFVAGARTVVATLWPLRDDSAALLFDRFYRHLAAGKSVAGAMAAARKERLDEGAPTHAWAGAVVLGDGDLVPFPAGRRRRPVLWLGALIGLALGSGAALTWKLLARRARTDSV